MSIDKGFSQPRTIGVAGVTKRGVAHRCYGTRCQDAHMIRRVKQVAIWKDGGKRDRLLPGKEYVVAAVADGLGSEAHSDIGAHAAVNTAVSTMCELIGTWCATGDSALAISMPRFLEQAMIKANNAVVKKAASMELPANEFDATLAIAVYDGEQLFYGSAGDSGVIAKTDAGFELLTRPSRVGEAGTYPLYCREKWEISACGHVRGFLLATDGLLELLVPEFNNENLNEKAVHLFMGAGHKPVSASDIDAALEKRVENVVHRIQGNRYTYDDATVVVALDWDYVEPAAVLKEDPDPAPVPAAEPAPAPAAEPAPEPVPVTEPEPEPVPQAELDPKPAGPEIASSINISLDPDMPDPEATVVLSAEGGTDVPALEPIAMLENMLGICFEYDELLEACQAFVKKHDEGARSDGGQRDVPINTDPTYE
ncbi:MAG: protein phosphatase 2C domain-containing protein [Collinsella sp.]|jgi:serine/threonine protein phosphatase PrpC|nr:protein phosphatase 2C domain-containing protein [Collinsella sp.]MEE0329759.1 protein phosphatase 2C domain-containing protein [Collinsella sp.]